MQKTYKIETIGTTTDNKIICFAICEQLNAIEKQELIDKKIKEIEKKGYTFKK